jgi:hypothetical protein
MGLLTMLKRIASLILFAMLAGGPRVRGDELVRWHHEWQGTALVESPMGTFSAALAYEDFDPQHTPEIGYKVLFRLYLTPFQRFASQLAPSDLPAALQVGTTKDGHSIFEWSGWKVDALSCSEERRVSNKLLAGQHPPVTSVRVVAKQVRDTIIIVLLGKE